MKPVAIIGASCRLPGARGVEEFWRLLRDGVDAVTEAPTSRSGICDSADPLRACDERATRWGGFLEGIDEFDAAFFGIEPDEARALDPQQRLLLEAAWEALEDAGQATKRLASSRTGVFVGIGPGDYGRLALRDPSRIGPFTNTGNFLSVAANRLSFFFDLHGPSLAIDTACSSSLIAAHLACRSLSSGECDMALAGGVNVILSPEITAGLAALGALSQSGRCKAFDAHADGYVRGEGVGFVTLKPLAAALEDGDPVYAVIRGSAVNHNGLTNGLTAPRGRFQQAVIRDACRDADLSPEEVQYVEAHASSTLIGDLIEAEALGTVYGAARPEGSVCRVGSVKTNLGHLEMASGVASLIKVALALDRCAIPPSLHFKEPNPYIRFDDYRLHVQTTLIAWPDAAARVAAVSSFGLGGANAHLIVAGPPRDTTPRRKRAAREAAQTHILPLSARSPEALRALARSYLLFLTEETNSPAPPLRDICYTASVRRSHHDYRLSFTFKSPVELRAQIESYLRGELPAGAASGRRVMNLHHRPQAAERTEGQAVTRLASLGERYVRGGKVDWGEVYPRRRTCVRLPSYPWQRQRYWLDDGGE